MGHIQAELDARGDLGGVLDGELYSHDILVEKGFPFLIGLIKRQDWDVSGMSKKKAEKVSDLETYRAQVKFLPFDFIPQSEWDSRVGVMPQDERLRVLEALFPTDSTAKVSSVKHELVETEKRLIELNGEFLSEGFEGSMLKDPKATYQFTRTVSWLKYKTFLDSEYEITGYYQGEGKWTGSLGGFTVKTAGGLPFRCGGGRITQQYRQQLWDNRDSLVGQKATIRFFELTPDGIPRFPVFISIRPDGF
jgi:ATP-dependent DNA ligase